MLKIDRTHRKLVRMEGKTLSEAKLLERYDLQQMIIGNTNAFILEMEEDLLLVGQEVQPSELVRDRIDLLAIDTDGASVVIELKRSDQKLQLLQALSYAAMLSQWKADDFVRTRAEFAKETPEIARMALREHVAAEEDAKDDINTRQRVVLFAEAFDYALLQTADWLTRTYEVDIRCYKFSYVRDGQWGRFDDDLQFWKSKLSQPNEVTANTSGNRVRFYLRTDDDFVRFKQALEGEVQSASFIDDRG
jgi:hypothetical protein